MFCYVVVFGFVVLYYLEFIATTTTTAIFISCTEKFTLDKYMQREKLTVKIEHSHVEIAKAHRAKWLGQAEKNIVIKLQSIKKKRKRDTISIDTHTHTHTHTTHTQREVDVHTLLYFAVFC